MYLLVQDQFSYDISIVEGTNWGNIICVDNWQVTLAIATLFLGTSTAVL